MIQLSIKGNCFLYWIMEVVNDLYFTNIQPTSKLWDAVFIYTCQSLTRQSPLKRLRTPPENPQTHLALMLVDVSRINDVKRVFYRFITVFIAASQPRSDPEMLCKVSLQVVSLPWSVSFSHIRNEQKNMDWSFSLCLIDSGTTWPPL